MNRKEYKKKYRTEHREEISKYNKKYLQKHYKENKDTILEEMRKYYQKNKDKIIKRVSQYYTDNIEKRKKYAKNYKINNPDKVKIWRKKDYINNKGKKKEYNVIYYKKYYKKIGLAISKSLKGNKCGHHWETLLNYTLKDLIKHLKKTVPKGYDWNDYINGKLHLDHILPIRLFQFNNPKDEEFKQCWGLYNLQLLTKKDNLSKGSSINNPILLGLLLKEMV